MCSWRAFPGEGRPGVGSQALSICSNHYWEGTKGRKGTTDAPQLSWDFATPSFVWPSATGFSIFSPDVLQGPDDDQLSPLCHLPPLSIFTPIIFVNQESHEKAGAGGINPVLHANLR